jgi:ubiquinone/menaquinone biosynthesis C-methylase UbiE
MISSTQRFSNRVGFYVRSRPKYPVALLRFFQNELKLSPVHAVADIGSGTGFLTELFVRNGNPTFAVEPNAPMRAAAQKYLGEWSNFHNVDATAEATTLDNEAVDFVTAGQAFHWFNVPLARREFQRILKPGGVVALIWNERVAGGSAFMDEFEQLVQKHRKEAIRGDDGTDDIKQFFGKAGYQTAKFENPQTLDCQGMIDRIASSSYMKAPEDAGYAEQLSGAQLLFDQHQQNGAVVILHETQVFYGPLIR